MPEKKANPRVYLAGPDVFLPEQNDLIVAKKAICNAHGLEGCWPLDNHLNLKGLEPAAAGMAIAKANEGLMQSCDAIIANLTPWDGPSADVGTAFEVGYMRALGKPCFAYSNDARSFEQRAEVYALDHDQGPMQRDSDGNKITASGRKLECFQLNDNLMLDGAVHMSGGTFNLGAIPVWTSVYFTDLSAFRLAVLSCSRTFGVIEKNQTSVLKPEIA